MAAAGSIVAHGGGWLPQGTSLASQGRDEMEEKRLPQGPSSRTEEKKWRRGGCHGREEMEEKKKWAPSGKKGFCTFGALIKHIGLG